MHSKDGSHVSLYNVISGKQVDREALITFSKTVLPGYSPDRLLSSWWMRAEDDCCVAAIHQSTGIVAGLCAGRPSKWVIGGETHSAVAICDWYVAPVHRGRMLGRRLLRWFEKPNSILYAFSLSDDAIAYVTRLGWVGPYTAALMALPLPRVARVMHAMFPFPRGINCRDCLVDSAALPLPLADDLNRIEALRAGNAPAHMQRGANEWSWRLSVCGKRIYNFCVAYRDGEPVGYSVVRRLTPGSSRLLGRVPGALLVDLVAVDDDAQVLRALITRAMACASGLGAAITLAVTTNAAQRHVLTIMGFLSPTTPLLGRLLTQRAPQYMWLPRGPAAQLNVNCMSLTFADSDVDLRL